MEDQVKEFHKKSQFKSLHKNATKENTNDTVDKRMERILEAAPNAFILTDNDGRISLVNQQLINWFGYSREELIGQKIEILIPHKYRASHVGKRIQYYKEGKTRPMGSGLELYGLRKDGTEFPVEISLSIINGEQEKNVVGIIRDISEEKKNLLQQQLLIEASALLTETVSYQGRIDSIAKVVAPRFCDICVIRMVKDSFLEVKAISGLKEEDLDLIKKIYTEAKLDRNSDFGAAYAWRSGNTQIVEKVTDVILREAVNDENAFQLFRNLQVRSYITVPMKTRGQTLGVISFIHTEPRIYSKQDINFAELITSRCTMAVDNARLYKEAQDAIELRENVLSIVAHDLRNPLGAVKGFNDLLSEIECSEEIRNQINENSSAINRSVLQMERLISDLLDFAKIQSGTLNLEYENCTPNILIADSIEVNQHNIDRKAISIGIEIPENIPQVMCDPVRIRQVFSNLLGNAVKFSPEHSLINIRLTLTDSEFVFSVSDCGPGISKKDLNQVFQKFWQTKKSSNLGTGLGLSIAKGIIESHHGRIWVESEEGHGATFYFSLPRK